MRSLQSFVQFLNNLAQFHPEKLCDEVVSAHVLFNVKKCEKLYVDE